MGNTLETAIKSVLSQTYKNFEIIIVDDGSVDSTAEICDKYKEKYPEIVKVKHQENKGVASARNTALGMVTGDYVFFCDADDSCGNTMLEEMVKAIVNHNADIVAVNVNKVTDGHVERLDLIKEEEIYSGTNHDKVFYSFYGDRRTIATATHSKLFRRDLFDTITFIDGFVYEDKRIMHRLLDSADTIVFCNKGEYFYIMNDNSITHARSLKTERDDYIATVDRYDYFISKRKEEKLIQLATYDLVDRLISYYSQGERVIDNSEKKELVNQLRKCMNEPLFKKDKKYASKHMKINIFLLSPKLYTTLFYKGNRFS
jgi:glycosyltransferase involved in cell wall biosynthesis